MHVVVSLPHDRKGQKRGEHECDSNLLITCVWPHTHDKSQQCLKSHNLELCKKKLNTVKVKPKLI